MKFDIKYIIWKIKFKMCIRKVIKEKKKELKEYCDRINKEVMDDLFNK